MDHAAIDADIMDIGVGVFCDTTGIGQGIAPAIAAVPFRDWEFQQIDVIPLRMFSFTGPVLTVLGANLIIKNGPADLDELPHRRVTGQAKHHGEA